MSMAKHMEELLHFLSWIYFYLQEDKEQDPRAFKCIVA